MNENNTSENPSGIEAPTPKGPQGVRDSHLGPVLGVLLLALVLVAVGLFLWGDNLMKNGATEDGRYIQNNEPETPRAAADMQIFGTLSPSNELDAIEADVKSTNLESLDADLTSVELELDTALGPQ